MSSASVTLFTIITVNDRNSKVDDFMILKKNLLMAIRG